jgi:hypothetical protein
MSLLDYPIYSNDTIFGKLRKESGKCPARTDICNNLPGLSVIAGTIILPKCSGTEPNNPFEFTNSKETSSYGCCVVDASNETCGTHLPSNIIEGGEFYDMGIDITDANGTNKRSICHSAPIRKRTLVISEFITIIVISAIILVLTTVMGGCYEFIFKYGECKECIYYKSKCTNRERLSIIDYIFPIEICNYPYQACNRVVGNTTTKPQAGGEGIGKNKVGFMSTYAEYVANGTKCITVHEDSSEGKQHKPFPYNLIDYSNDVFKWELSRMPFKAFALFFLYTVLLSRYFLSVLLKNLSIRYQKVVNHSPILSNIMFLCFTGILFNIIANYTGITALNGASTYLLHMLLMILSFAFSISAFATMMLLWWSPPVVFEKYYRKCNIPSNYYKLINSTKIFYSLYEYKTAKSLGRRILHLCGDILLLPIIFIVLMISLCVGFFGSTIAFLYMVVSLIFNLIYVPLSNTIEFMDIIKSHGNLLTILFCLTVLMASLNKLDNITTGILGGLLGILILYTAMVNIK